MSCLNKELVSCQDTEELNPSLHSGPRRAEKQTYFDPVGEPVAFRVCALHCEQNVAPRDDAALRHGLDFNGQVAMMFL